MILDFNVAFDKWQLNQKNINNVILREIVLDMHDLTTTTDDDLKCAY